MMIIKFSTLTFQIVCICSIKSFSIILMDSFLFAYIWKLDKSQCVFVKSMNCIVMIFFNVLLITSNNVMKSYVFESVYLNFIDFQSTKVFAFLKSIEWYFNDTYALSKKWKLEIFRLMSICKTLLMILKKLILYLVLNKTSLDESSTQRFWRKKTISQNTLLSQYRRNQLSRKKERAWFKKM